MARSVGLERVYAERPSIHRETDDKGDDLAAAEKLS